MECSTSAPAKAILFGEHAVVYGVPAIAVPLSLLRAYAHVQTTDQSLTVVAADLARPPFRWGAGETNTSDPLERMARMTVQYLQAETAFGKVTIKSDIPIASGLGSGAAVSTALGRAIGRLLGVTISDDALNRLVFEVEKLHHGSPSGIDNTVVVYEKSVYFVKGQASKTMRIRSPIQIVLADTGVASLTREAVAHVRDRYQRQLRQTSAIFEEIREVVTSARAAIETGNLHRLGQMMTENHRLLQSLQVSSPELDRLVEEALKSGADGAKLSGGGRGGYMLALVNERTLPRVKLNLLKAGAKRVIATQVGARGHRNDDPD